MATLRKQSIENKEIEMWNKIIFYYVETPRISKYCLLFLEKKLDHNDNLKNCLKIKNWGRNLVHPIPTVGIS